MPDRSEQPLSLRDVDAWHEVLIPASDRPVKLHSLHRDPESGAALSLVRFPPGWRRPSTGHYTCAEEFVVLEGGIRVGVEYSEGDYVYLPPRSVRTDSVSESGALVVSWFSAPVSWVDGPAPDPSPGSPVVSRDAGVLRASAAEVEGAYEVREGEDVGWPLRSAVDVLDPETSRWQWVPAGARGAVSAPRLHLRTWG